MNGTAELLEAAAQGDEQACEQMLRDNSGLIWSIVRRYYGRGVEPDDLYQLGCLGFIKAVKGFDITFGTQFSTYAVPKIAGEIRRFLRDDGAIKVSRSVREQAAVIFAARERLKNVLGREPALSELAEETGLPAEEIAQCELAVMEPDSLQREMGDGLTLEGRGDDRAPRAARSDREAAGARENDDPAALFQGDDAAAGGAHSGRVAGAGIASGAPGDREAASGAFGRGVKKDSS